MNKKLLIADDALLIREMIKDIAASDGWEIVGEASDGRQAVDLYDELRPDVITLDLVMPEYDGLYALRRIIARNKHARVVMVTALDQADIQEKARGIGASDFIVKPFGRDDVVEALERALEVEPHCTEPHATH